MSVCHPSAVVPRGRLIALAHSASSFALALVHTQFQSVPLLPRPKKIKMLHAVCGADLKNKSSRSGRVQSVSSPPVDGQSPSSFVVESSLLPAQFPPRKPRLRRSEAGVRCCGSWRRRSIFHVSYGNHSWLRQHGHANY